MLLFFFSFEWKSILIKEKSYIEFVCIKARDVRESEAIRGLPLCPPKDAPGLRGGQVETTSLSAVFMYIKLVVGNLT